MLRFRDGAIVVRLTDDAARAASARLATAPRAARLASLGLASLDAVAASLGGATFEPEFPPEPRAASFAARPSAAAAALEAFYVVHLAPGIERDAALAAFRIAPDVVAADPIALVPVESAPNDSLWPRAWHLHQPSRRDLHAVEAWDRCRGDTAVVIGIIDTGVLLDHPDLHEQLWSNPAERTGFAGVDDDGNGFVDDVRGWDFVALDSAGAVVAGEDWRDADPDPNDFTGHGTAVAGLAGASTDNGIGVAGVAWHTRLMPLRAGYSAALQPSGWVDLAWAARAIVYAARNGASVLNLSFGSVRQVDLVAAADFATAAGVTIVVAAGNGPPLHYLATRDDVIAVAATDSTDRVATFSSRGPQVAIAAPGVNLATTILSRPAADSAGRRQPAYVVGASGTSFSAPLVSGAIALLQSDRRARGLTPWSPYEVKLRLVETADDIATDNPGVTGYGAGRLNLVRALADPARSFTLPAGALTVGPSVRIPALAPPALGLFALSDGRLLVAGLEAGGEVRSVPLAGAPMGGVAAADLGGGRGIGCFVGTRAGTLEGFDAAGRPLPGWPVAIHAGAYGGDAQPSLGDLDGDGVLEVVWGGDDGAVRAWHADGTSVAGFPRVLLSLAVDVRIAVADLDGVPGAEIAATLAGGPIFVLRGDGSDLPGWPQPGPPPRAFVPSAPLAMRFGPTGRPAIAVATGYSVDVFAPDGTKLLSRSPFGYQLHPLAAADLDGDGGDELVLVRTDPYLVTVLYAGGETGASWSVNGGFDPSPDGVALVGSLAPGGAPGVLVRGPEGGLLAFSLLGVPLAGFPKPGGAGESPSVDDLRGDGVSGVFAGAGRDSSLYVLAAGEATWNPASQFWPTAQGNYARTGSTYGAPPLGVLDNIAPARVADLAAGDPGTHTATLRWTTPADEGATGRPAAYEVRWATFALDDANFEGGHPLAGAPVPGDPGSEAGMEAAGLPENTTLWFALRSRDAAGNASAVSPAASVTTAAAAPGAVRDLRVVAWTDTSVTLRWTATGDDGASGRPARYRVRAAFAPLDSATFAFAPIVADVAAGGDAGASESAVLAGLSLGARCWIALVADDASGLASPLSNVVSVVPGPLAVSPGLAVAPRTRPSGVPVELWWQAVQPPGAGPREVRLFDVAGRLVRALPLGAGAEGVARWDGRDRDGHAVRSGLYFAVLAVGGERASTRVVLVR